MMNAQIERVETQTGLLCQLIKKFTNGQAVGIPMALVAEGEIEDNRLVVMCPLDCSLDLRL